MFSCAILVTVASEGGIKRVIYKTLTGTLENSAALREHAYSNIHKISSPKKLNIFRKKNSDIFISLLKI